MNQIGTTPDVTRTGWLNQQPVRFPDLYAWFVLFSAMDVMLTWVILTIGGSEANPIAREVIDQFGLPGAIAFKFTLIVMVIVICEVVARMRPRVARGLAIAAMAISVMPVIYSLSLLALHVVLEH
jgi:hypothetical protein